MSTLLKDASSGTYIETVNLSQVATPAAADIGAIVGQFKRGPINTPLLSLSTDQFIEQRGKPDPENLTFPSTYCGYFFLRRASQLYSVRVVNSDNSHSYSGLKVSSTGGATPTATAAAAVGSAVADPDTDVTLGANDLFYIHKIGPGVYGDNTSIAIRSDNAISPVIVLAGVTNGSGTLVSATSYSYRIAVVTSFGEMKAAVAVAATPGGTNNAIQVTIPYVSNAIAYRLYGRTAGSEELIAEIPQPSTSGNITYVDTGVITPDGTPVVADNYSDLFYLDIYDTEISSDNPVESFEVSLGFQVDGFNQQLEIESKVNTFSQHVRVVKASTPVTTTIFPVAITALGDGADGNAPTASDVSLGWDAFADKETTTVRHLINGGVTAVSVQQKIDYVCKRRQDCTGYLDVPAISQSAQNAVIYRKQTLNMNSTYCALYTPDLLIQDDFNGRTVYIPPSGHAAGVGAISGLRAPAGLNRGVLSDVLGLRYDYKKEERNILAAAKVNYARNMPGRGIAFMEAFTQESQMSALSFLNVRYTLNAIAPAVENSLDFSLFEPNDDITRRQIVGLVSEFLDVLRNDRAIEEYMVICDDTINPAIVTGNGQLNVDIRIIPTLPIQRIRVRLIVTKQGVSLAEVEA